MKNHYYYKVDFLEFFITEEDGYITGVYFSKPNLEGYNYKESKEISTARNQIEEYLNAERRTFDLKIKLNRGTEFQKSVWNALLTIPYGETKSYKDIAEQVGSNKAYRAVGLANNKNPISIIIPCHRVIGSDKKLVGYGGGIGIKKKLLELEGALYKEEKHNRGSLQ